MDVQVSYNKAPKDDLYCLQHAAIGHGHMRHHMMKKLPQPWTKLRWMAVAAPYLQFPCMMAQTHKKTMPQHTSLWHKSCRATLEPLALAELGFASLYAVPVA